MNTKHVPSLELCQEFDRLCKEKGIVVPWTEYQWEKRMGEWSIVKSKELGVPYIDTADMKLYLPAPLVSEQGEWLPERSVIVKDHLISNPYVQAWFYHEGTYQQHANTEANARQKMLNYLIAEGVITNL